MISWVSKNGVRRIRWFDRNSDDQTMPIDWRVASPLLATLFLNFVFLNNQGVDFRMSCALPIYSVFVGAIAITVTAVFFMGPALATHRAGKVLFLVIEDSLGALPAFGLRLCYVIFLVLWIATLVAFPTWQWSFNFPGRQVSSAELGMFAAILLIFLFITAQQGVLTRATLAVFNNKLGIAILIAALIRVREGLPAVLGGFRMAVGNDWLSQACGGLSEVATYLAPLALIAANFGYRSGGQRQIAITGLMGIALPLFVTLLIVGVVGASTYASSFYQPSLQPSISMALWSHAARSALPGRMMIAAVTAFGAIRFGGKALAEVARVRTPGGRREWILFGCLVGIDSVIVVTFLRGNALVFTTALDWSARCLGVTSAVITVDFLSRKHRIQPTPKVDWIGLMALIAGLATPLYVPRGLIESTPTWWYSWMLPSYLMAFLACLCGRMSQRMMRRFATSA